MTEKNKNNIWATLEGENRAVFTVRKVFPGRMVRPSEIVAKYGLKMDSFHCVDGKLVDATSRDLRYHFAHGNDGKPFSDDYVKGVYRQREEQLRKVLEEVREAETKIDWSRVKVQVKQIRIERPPGVRMLAIAEMVFSPMTVKGVFDQGVSDYRIEMFDAMKAGAGPWKLRMIKGRHWFGFVSAVVLELLPVIGKIIKAVKGA